MAFLIPYLRLIPLELVIAVLLIALVFGIGPWLLRRVTRKADDKKLK